MTTPEPPVGLIGLTSISGEVGKLIEVGQWLDGTGFRQWEHAFISIGGGKIVEAEPGGARVRDWTEYSVVHWCQGLYVQGTPTQLQDTDAFSRKAVGVPYSPADYFALVAHRLHLPAPGLKNFISSSGHMICSQLVDWVYAQAGIHLFTDNRWPGYVTPGDLYLRDMELSANNPSIEWL